MKLTINDRMQFNYLLGERGTIADGKLVMALRAKIGDITKEESEAINTTAIYGGKVIYSGVQDKDIEFTADELFYLKAIANKREDISDVPDSAADLFEKIINA